MVFFRDANINTPATHMRPGAGMDSLGNPTRAGADTAVATVLAGVFPPSNRRDPYRLIAGGEMNLRHWSVAVVGSTSIQEGDAIHVPTGNYPGKYRVQQFLRPPNDPVTLTQCIRETTT